MQAVAMLSFLPGQLSTGQINSEIVFLVDRSTSMIRHNRIQQAVETLRLAINSLPEHTYFQIVRPSFIVPMLILSIISQVSFGSSHTFLFENGSVLSTPDNIKQALAMIDEMKADMGGTALYAPLYELYNNPPVEGMHFVISTMADAVLGYSRNLFIFTDGEITSVEVDSVMRLIKKNSDSTRCFTFGIGQQASYALVTGTIETMPRSLIL